MSTILKVPALPSLQQIALAFPKRKVLVVGDLVADHYIYGQTDRVSREAPVLIVRYEDSEVKLGGAANAAANVRSLGGQVTAIGTVGQDEMGRELRRQFKSAGIRLLSVGSENVQTETKTRILAGSINTTRQQMLRLLPRQRAEVAGLIGELARGVNAVMVSDYGSGLVSEECRAVLRKLAEDGMPVCVDSRYELRAFTNVTLCKPNEPELEALTRIPLKSERDLLRAGRAAVKLLSCSALLVTRGRNGMAVFDRHHAELIPVYGPHEAVDVTGAGDTVIAALTLALSASAGILDAARIANVAAGIVVQKQGTATVGREELLQELSGRTP